MTNTTDSGTPFPSDAAGTIDEWSEAIYAALLTWEVAKSGEWTRWEPGYLLLKIEHVEGRAIEPIVLYTSDEELTVSFGHWITHDPAPVELWDAAADVKAKHAKILVEQWLNGDFRTAVFTDAKGNWCGTPIIEPGDLLPQLEMGALWLREFHPKQVEVRTPEKSGWRIYPVDPEWLKPPEIIA